VGDWNSAQELSPVGPDAHDVYALPPGTQIWRVINLGDLYSLLTLADGVLYFGTDFHYV
jgi:hypothetical protein